MIKITLPFPPSSNGMYGQRGGYQRYALKHYKEWLANNPKLAEKAIGQVHIHYQFYWPDDRIRDGQSYLKASTDYLVKQKVVQDDNWKIVGGESWGYGYIDKKNPRVEITVAPLESVIISGIS